MAGSRGSSTRRTSAFDSASNEAPETGQAHFATAATPAVWARVKTRVSGWARCCRGACWRRRCCRCCHSCSSCPCCCTTARRIRVSLRAPHADILGCEDWPRVQAWTTGTRLLPDAPTAANARVQHARVGCETAASAEMKVQKVIVSASEHGDTCSGRDWRRAPNPFICAQNRSVCPEQQIIFIVLLQFRSCEGAWHRAGG